MFRQSGFLLAVLIAINAISAQAEDLNSCLATALEFSGECNLECPMDFPAAAACHLTCQALYDKRVSDCKAAHPEPEAAADEAVEKDGTSG